MAGGYVYVLENPTMRGLFKVGCTSKSPAERAAGLSAASGVPVPFRVLCHARFHAFQRLEQNLHQFLRGFRVSESREFFRGALALKEAATWLYFHPAGRDFQQAADVLVAPHLLGPCRVNSLDELLNPWKAAM